MSGRRFSLEKFALRMALRTHKLDISRVKAFSISILIDQKLWLLSSALPLKTRFVHDGVRVFCEVAEVKSRTEVPPVEAGNYSSRGTYTIFKFRIPAQSAFLEDTLVNTVGHVRPNEQAYRLIKSACIRFSISSINHFIDRYRVEVHDPFVRPVGFADIVKGEFVCNWKRRKTDSREIFSGTQSLGIFLMKRKKSRTETALVNIQRRLSDQPEFHSICVLELEKSRMYGQSRECVVWAATLMDVTIEEFLVRGFKTSGQPNAAVERFRKRCAGETSKKKRFELFTEIAGCTLSEFLAQIIARSPYGPKDSVWHTLPNHIEKVFKTRNGLLHRQKPTTNADATLAYDVAMNVYGALSFGLPYDGEVQSYL